MATLSPTLRVSINCIDHIVVPSGPLDRCKHPLVPVIRIFGDSSLGHKVCLTIHQVYPYFFIEYTGDLSPEKVNQYITRLTVSLNYALAISLKRDPLSPKSQFVRSVILVKGIHFYGFHSRYTPFLKILIAQPSVFSRAVAVMQSGVLMKTKFKIYESHLSFILQFMSDFGLYGCGWIDLDQELYIRRTAEQEYEQQEGVILVEGCSAHSAAVKFQQSPHPKQATTNLEIDVISHQILNRHRLQARQTHHRLNIPAPPLPSEPLVPSVRELWEDERSRRAKQGLDPSPVMPQDPSEGSRGKGPTWSSEARFWDQLRERVAGDGSHIAVQDEPEWARMVMTTFESVQALWGHSWRTWKPTTSSKMATSTNHQEYTLNSLDSRDNLFHKQEHTLGDVDVDTTIINSQEPPLFLEGDDHHEISIVQDVQDGGGAEEKIGDFFGAEFPLGFNLDHPGSPVVAIDEYAQFSFCLR
jgi:DNA polymerase zeta